MDEERTPLIKSSEQSLNYTENSTEDIKGLRKDEEKDAKKKKSFGLFKFATKFDVLLMIIGSVFAIVNGAAWPVISIVFGQLTNDFIGQVPTNGSNITGNNSVLDNFEDTMTTYAIYYVITGASVWVASTIHVVSWTIACERQTHKIRQAFFKSILRQDQSWFDTHSSGELTTRLSDDIERIREGLGDKFALCLQFISQFISGFVIGFIKDWKLTLVMMSLTPVLAVCAAFIGVLLTTFSKKEQTSYAQAGSIAEEVLSCFRTVTSFNGQKYEIKRYANSLKAGKRIGIKKAFLTGMGTGLTMLFIFGAYALAFWYGSTLIYDYKESNGEEGIGPDKVMTVFFCVLIGSMALGSASPHANSVATANGAAATIMEIIHREPPIDSSSERGDRPEIVKGHIELANVNFSYATRKEVKVLKDFNLKIEPGQTIALVGASGCGKSTVVKLIQRFYDTVSGHIYLDGQDLKSLNIKWLRQNIGVVSQEPVLFGRTIAENIQLGDPTATYERIEEAAKAANAHDFIMNLPKKYDTLVGERGAQLSGGQKQRVAIARALVGNPKILLLDEATSALDSSSEKVVQDALEKAREGRTTIVVAHRLSTIQNADMIYVLENGVMVENGRHNELMDKKSVYYQLVTLQMIADMKENGDDVLENGFISKEKDRPGIKRSLSQQISRQESKVDKQEEEKDLVMPNFFRIFKENTPEWPFIVLGTIGSVINGTVMPLFAIIFSEIVKTFSESGDKLKENGVFWSLMFLVLGVVNFFSNFMQSFFYGTSGEKMTERLRLKSFSSMLRQDITFYDDPKHSTGALTTRLATDASNLKNATGIRLGLILQSLVSVIAGLTIAFVYGWMLALVILAAAPIMAAAGAMHMKALTGGQKKDAELLEEAGKTASEGIENNVTVQSLTSEPHFFAQYCEKILKPYQANIRHSFVYAFVYGFSQGIIFMLYGGAFKFGAYLVVNDGMEPDKVFRVFFAIAFSGIAVGQATSFLPDYSKARLSAAYIFKQLSTFPGIDIFGDWGVRPGQIDGGIELKNVTFKYPLRPNVEVLQGMNIKVEPGQTVALVGTSGCGKSTVISLIQRYYDPSSGDILIDGQNIKDIHLHTLRSFISVVSQEPILFDSSIKDNISYGLEEEVSMDMIIKSARIANAHEFIVGLPLGYDTMVGEKGTQLSGGQKQRVAIARALIRNPRILLLDEATSALDTESEKVVQTALDNAQEGRTCIVIAHRLSTIQNADVIFVIENGNVVEQGTHQELLEKNGAYASLVKGQQFN